MRLIAPMVDHLMNPFDLSLNGIIICAGACCSLVARHVHTQNVQVLG